MYFVFSFQLIFAGEQGRINARVYQGLSPGPVTARGPLHKIIYFLNYILLRDLLPVVQKIIWEKVLAPGAIQTAKRVEVIGGCGHPWHGNHPIGL